jgi:hypothetical protein
MLTLISVMLIVASLLRVKQGFAENFSIIVLPDTQYYSESYPAIIDAQTQWIVNKKDELNIVHVAHVGDIVDDSEPGNASHIAQWNNADTAMSLLEDPFTTSLADGIPYGISPGNHDQWPVGNPDGTELYNLYFGESRFIGRGYYGGHYGIDNDNHYSLFSASGMDFIVVYLEFDPIANPGVLAWADDLLKTYGNRRAIIVSHYLIEVGEGASFGSQGAAIYNALKDNPNLFLMLSGHKHGEGKRVDVEPHNHTIHTLLADYQERSNGGDGWLRILEFSPLDNLIRVETYSPTLNLYETDSDSRFELSYDMSLPCAAPPSIVSSGTPADGLTNVDVDTDLSWAAVADAVSYNVYFGTTENPSMVANVSSAGYNLGLLSPGTTYYWRIDALNDCGGTTGTEWSFTAQGDPGTTGASGDNRSGGGGGGCFIVTAADGWIAFRILN